MFAKQPSAGALAGASFFVTGWLSSGHGGALAEVRAVPYREAK